MRSRRSEFTNIKEANVSGSGRLIADIFMELPDRRLFTDYYKTIKEPVSLKEIEVSGEGFRRSGINDRTG